MKKKKTLIWLLGGSAALLLVLGTTLYLQNQRINALDTAGSSGGKSEELAPAGDNEAPVATGTTQPDTPDSDTDESSPSGRRIQVGTVVPDGSAELPEAPADGTAKVHEVSLPEGALDWSKPMQEPQLNDIIEIEVLPGKRYEFKVTSVSIYEEPRKVVVLGRLMNCNGTANMMLLSGRMLLQINDQSTPIIYNLYFDRQNEKYIVQEIDPEKKAIMHPSGHEPKENEGQSLLQSIKDTQKTPES